jgi:hypothetical protein
MIQHPLIGEGMPSPLRRTGSTAQARLMFFG